jgi:hypothetical protein
VAAEKDKRGSCQSSPLALVTGAMPELSWQRWTVVAAVLTRRQSERGNGEVEPEFGVDTGCKDGALGCIL